MTATASRIGFIQNQFRRVIAETAGTKTRHGDFARESDDPIETFFDNVADAQAVANARQALMSAERRRFQVAAVGADSAMGLSYATGSCPLASYTDTDREVNAMTSIICDITIDYARQSSSFTIWG